MRAFFLASSLVLLAACSSTGTPDGFYDGFDAAVPATCATSASGSACVCTSSDPCTSTCGNGCGVSCTGTHGCAAQCGANCAAACTGTDRCHFLVGPESHVSCTGTHGCETWCRGDCTQACTGTDGCVAHCLGGSCVITCAGAGCEVDCGSLTRTECSGGAVIACGTGCPPR